MGEEGGMALWANAVAASHSEWDVTGPEQFRPIFVTKGVTYVGTVTTFTSAGQCDFILLLD